MLCFSSLIHLLRDRIALHFLLFWFICLMGIAVAGRMIASRAAVSLCRSNQSRVRSRPTPPQAVSAILFGLFLAFYVAMILWREDFAFFDNDQLTDFSVAGRALPPPIWPSEGRFFPLAFQEFNALRFITRSPMGYQLFAVVQVLIVVLLLLVILRELRPSYGLLLMAALMLGPAFSISFTGLVYPERDVLFWLVIMLFCLQRYSETRSPASFVTCLIGAHFVLYYKETVVVLIAAFVISYLCIEFYAERHAVRRFQQEFIRENALYFSLLAVCGVYVVFFATTVLPWAPSSYVAQHRQPLVSVLRTYLVIDWLPWLLLAAFLFRLAYCLFRGYRLDPLWDSLATGALAYFIAILALRVISGYYMAPVDLIAVPYLGRLALACVRAAQRPPKVLAAAALACLVVHDAAYSSFRVIERKSLIVATRQFADFLEKYARTSTSSTIELYFPRATGHQLATLSAYLKYRGIPLDGASSRVATAGHQFIIKSPASFTENRCVEYSKYTCLHAETPSPGTLIVVLPDDNIAPSELYDLTKNSSLLFRVRFTEFAGQNSWFRSLYAISPEFAATGLPQHWLQLDIFQREGPKPAPFALWAHSKLHAADSADSDAANALRK